MIEIRNLSLQKKVPVISQLDMQVMEGETYVLLSSGEEAINHMVNIFSGLEHDYTGNVVIDGIDFRSGASRAFERLTVLFPGREWPPEMKVGGVVRFVREHVDVPEDEFEELYIQLNLEKLSRKKVGELEEVQWRSILFSLAQLKKGGNYVLRDIAKSMPLDFDLEFKKSLSRLKKKGASILYIADDVFLAPEIGDRIGFMKKGKLLMELKASKMKKMNVKELYFQFLAES